MKTLCFCLQQVAILSDTLITGKCALPLTSFRCTKWKAPYTGLSLFQKAIHHLFKMDCTPSEVVFIRSCSRSGFQAGTVGLMEQMSRGKRIPPCGGLLPWSAGGLGKWSWRSISVWINPCFLPQRDRIFPRDSRRGAIRSGFACFLSPVLCPRAAPFVLRRQAVSGFCQLASPHGFYPREKSVQTCRVCLSSGRLSGARGTASASRESFDDTFGSNMGSLEGKRILFLVACPQSAAF